MTNFILKQKTETLLILPAFTDFSSVMGIRNHSVYSKLGYSEVQGTDGFTVIQYLN